MPRIFHVATDEEILNGETTDVYFKRTLEVLRKFGLADKRVVAEITASSLPDSWNWAVLAGLEEALRLLEGRKLDVYAMPEGTLFRPGEPVMVIEGPYGEFCLLETALLGFLAQASAIATRAARCKKAAGDKLVLSFGIRRMHPAISPMIDRAAYIGGCDGFSGVAAEKLLGIRAVGTMPHALIIIFGDQRRAWRAFDEVLPDEIPRIALVDTFYDEKIESIMAAETLGERLHGVRLDTPSSRRGDMSKIIREVRWELDLRGYKNVKIFVSGGLDEEKILKYKEAGADGFGVGTYISGAPPIDFAMDLVEVEGEPRAKRGKLGGKKMVYRCGECFEDILLPFGEKAPDCKCGGSYQPLLRKYIENGRLIEDLPRVEEIRGYVLRQLEKVEL